MTLKRIHREIQDLKSEDLGTITLGPQDMDNPYLWKARIPGPEGSVYEGGTFVVDVQLGNDYPYVYFFALFWTINGGDCVHGNSYLGAWGLMRRELKEGVVVSVQWVYEFRIS